MTTTKTEAQMTAERMGLFTMAIERAIVDNRFEVNATPAVIDALIAILAAGHLRLRDPPLD